MLPTAIPKQISLRNSKFFPPTIFQTIISLDSFYFFYFFNYEFLRIQVNVLPAADILSIIPFLNLDFDRNFEKYVLKNCKLYSFGTTKNRTRTFIFLAILGR